MNLIINFTFSNYIRKQNACSRKRDSNPQKESRRTNEKQTRIHQKNESSHRSFKSSYRKIRKRRKNKFKAGTPTLNKLNKEISRKYGLAKIPKVIEIISAIPKNYKKKILPYIKAKPIRTASGIVVVAVMCKPHRCPHIATTGNICIYCPGGPDSDFEYSTQSYTGFEPTSMRAIRARYNPYIQTRDRIEQLKKLGHDCDKVEFIIMGGTFMSLKRDYRDYFIRNLHDSLSGYNSVNHVESVKYSEQSKSKCIGITIETRPDFCSKSHISDMLSYGCTRLEIGVQSIYEDSKNKF